MGSIQHGTPAVAIDRTIQRFAVSCCGHQTVLELVYIDVILPSGWELSPQDLKSSSHYIDRTISSGMQYGAPAVAIDHTISHLCYYMHKQCYSLGQKSSSRY